MAWEISISQEGWQQIREALKVMPKEDLCKAIADYNYETFHGYYSTLGNPHHKGNWSALKLMKLDRESLEEKVFECIEEVNTCDNGGYRYWIDPEGYHNVDINEGEFTYDKDYQEISILLSHSSGPCVDTADSIYNVLSCIDEVEEEIVYPKDTGIKRFTFDLKDSDTVLKWIDGHYFYVDLLKQLIDCKVR